MSVFNRVKAMQQVVLTVLALTVFLRCTRSYVVFPGPQVIATKGEVWPKPQKQLRYDGHVIVQPSNFKFEATDIDCPLLQTAFIRYMRVLDQSTYHPSRKFYKKKLSPISDIRENLTSINVKLSSACEDRPYPNMDESYELDVCADGSATAILRSRSIWGALRGLETFSQLLSSGPDNTTLIVNCTSITDSPRFTHRGLLIDTSRHYIPVSILLNIINAMEYNKLNVLHWHIVDDQSFPYVSKTFPELSDGAYQPTMVYNSDTVALLIEHARLRGIRVMPEFDTPGHTRSWGVSHPELLTTCFDPSGQPNGILGPINPTVESTYTFMAQLLTEVTRVFTDQYVHLGGDEVDTDCWESNLSIVEYMKKNNITSFHALEEYYIQRIVDTVDNLDRSSIVWQEVYQNGVRLPSGTVVHVWLGKWEEIFQQVTSTGLPTLLSECWYLDHLATGGDWRDFYNCDPHNFEGTDEQKKLVYGGEACMWGEVVDSTNVVQRIFPRASATAEKLWSAHLADDVNNAAKRLEEHVCRMQKRGIPAQPPNGPGFCY